jgi:branched-chain amino acid transport system permease protein
MAYFLQQLINGVTLGMIYGLIAIGYTMVYSILGMINFAHGQIYTIGAFVAVLAYTLLVAVGVSSVPLALLVVLFAAAGFTAVYGWALERLAYRPLRDAPRLAPLISAIGMSFLLTNAIAYLQGARVKPVQPIIHGSFTVYEDPGFTVHLSYVQILIWVLTVALMIAFGLMIARTRFGRSQRCVEQDSLMAQLVGIDVDRTISATFVIGAALAGVAGVMVMLYYGVVDFYMGFQAGIKAFTAAVLGGIGSLPGAILGGLLLGLVESLWSAYFSIEYKDVASFSILVLVLIFRPTGLLGRPEVEKV